MTTAPPTGDGGAPAWLPDEATLSRMAGELFRALPGQDPFEPSPAVASGPPGVVGPPMSPPNGPPPTSAPASTAQFASGFAVPTPDLPVQPVTPDVPDLTGLTGGGVSSPTAGTTPGGPSVPSGVPAAPSGIPAAPSGIPAGPSVSQFYFLTDTPGYTPAAPATPGYGEVALPPTDLSTDDRFAEPPWYSAGPQSVSPGSIPQLPLDPHPPFDVHAIRRDFPILSERINGKPLIWLDNAATTQKPQAVIDRLVEFYSRENSNIHRAAHELAARATDAYEGARRTIADFLGAGSPEEIIFVRGTTEGINLIANTWGRKNIREGDEIVISHLEHHANIVPWQMLAERTGAVIKVIPVDDDGVLLIDEYTKLLSDRTKLVSVTHVSNALGTVTPIKQIIDIGHRAGATVLIDGAQSVPHIQVNVTELDADFLVFSGHKIFGPTGIGAVYGKREILEDMPPWEGGGNMIVDVTLERATFHEPPGRFEAGTGNIADAAGLAAALDYVQRIGLPNIAAYEHGLVEYAMAGLRRVPGLTLIGTAPEKASVVSFVLDGYEPLEVGTALNQEGIAVRAGHHCAQPILRRFGLEATVRPSFAFYNTCEEVDALVAAVHRLAARRGH